jgi:hypothetical protein
MIRIVGGKRRYGTWSGNPKGTPEDESRCIVEVWLNNAGWIPHQCCRKRGHGQSGLYCKQHAAKVPDGLGGEEGDE